MYASANWVIIGSDNGLSPISTLAQVMACCRHSTPSQRLNQCWHTFNQIQRSIFQYTFIWNSIVLIQEKPLQVIHDCKKALDEGLSVGIILMDLSKAFDCIPHGLLLTKLKCYGLSDQACLLLKSYISDRKQRVKVGTPEVNGGQLHRVSPRDPF